MGGFFCYCIQNTCVVPISKTKKSAAQATEFLSVKGINQADDSNKNVIFWCKYKRTFLLKNL